MSVLADLEKHVGHKLSLDEKRLAVRLRGRQAAESMCFSGAGYLAFGKEGRRCECGTIAKPTRRGLESHSDPDGEPCYVRRAHDEIRVNRQGYRISTRERVCPSCMLPHCVCEEST